MGGSNKKENLVKLTPEEHYVAHQLLIKIYPTNDKLLYAAHAMANMGQITQKEYGWLKRKRIKMLSEKMIGSNNHSFGKIGTMTGKKHSQDSIDKMKTPRVNTQNMKKLTGENNPRFGKTHTPESLAKMKKPKPEGFGEGRSGILNPNYGKQHSEETTNKMKEAAQLKQKFKCPYCNFIGFKSHLVRYHGDKCKMNNRNII